MVKNLEDYQCPVEATLDLIGGRYKALILWHLGYGTLRFGQLGRRLPQATPKMLTQQLRELESDGLVSRTVYAVVPPKTEYALTPFGETFKPVLESMCSWGRAYLDRDATCCADGNAGRAVDAAVEKSTDARLRQP